MLGWLHHAADERAAGRAQPRRRGRITRTPSGTPAPCCARRWSRCTSRTSTRAKRSGTTRSSPRVATGVICGLGVDGYRLALQHLAGRARRTEANGGGDQSRGVDGSPGRRRRRPPRRRRRRRTRRQLGCTPPGSTHDGHRDRGDRAPPAGSCGLVAAAASGTIAQSRYQGCTTGPEHEHRGHARDPCPTTGPCRWWRRSRTRGRSRGRGRPAMPPPGQQPWSPVAERRAPRAAGRSSSRGRW